MHSKGEKIQRTAILGKCVPVCHLHDFFFFRVYLCEQLFEKSADEGSHLVSIQQVKCSFRVCVVINYSIGVAIKGTASLSWVNLNAFM